MHIIKLLRRQAEMYAGQLMKLVGKAKTIADIYRAHSTILKEFYTHAFKPTVDDNEVREFDVDSMNTTMDNINTDIETVYGELEYVSDTLQEAYNTNQDYKTKVKNKVKYLTSIVSDLSIMSGDSQGDYTVFKDSLSNYDFIDKNFSVGTQANIATSEGIAHIAIRDEQSMADRISEVKTNGNGIAGNLHVIKKVNIETVNEEYNIYAKYQSEDDPHNNINSIIDNQPQTWYEYEKVGIDEAEKVGRYDIEWATAQKMHDELTLKVIIKLKESNEINWIDITPYLPERSRSAIEVYSIKVSLNGSDFTPIYKDKEIIESEIHLVPQRYLSDPLFNNDTIAKFASQGVFNFPTVKAQYVEIVLRQTKPYDEYIGHTYYKGIDVSKSGYLVEGTIPEQSVPAFIQNGPVGKYQLESNKLIVKGIDIINGWRYSIGVRGIDIYNRKFEKTSEFVTKKFEVQAPIQKVVLYTNEIIPDEYMGYGLEKRNDWIRYFISINDTDWYPISPMHHAQVGTLKIPPKVYEINSVVSAEEKIAAINKGYITTDKDVKSIRLKVVLTRPEDMAGSTPILEEYGLKCIFGGDI